MGVTAGIISAITGAASAVNQRKQAKDQAKDMEKAAAVEKRESILTARRDAEKKSQKLRAYAAGQTSLLAGSGVSAPTTLG